MTPTRRTVLLGGAAAALLPALPAIAASKAAPYTCLPVTRATAGRP